jgi:hypothetical protein
MRIEFLASSPACFKNSACISSSSGDFLFFSSFITVWSSQSLIGESNISSFAVGFALPFFCLRVLCSHLIIFDFLLAYVPLFCALEMARANVLGIPLSLVITSLFSCIRTLLLQEVLF